MIVSENLIILKGRSGPLQLCCLQEAASTQFVSAGTTKACKYCGNQVISVSLASELTADCPDQSFSSPVAKKLADLPDLRMHGVFFDHQIYSVDGVKIACEEKGWDATSVQKNEWGIVTQALPKEKFIAETVKFVPLVRGAIGIYGELREDGPEEVQTGKSYDAWWTDALQV